MRKIPEGISDADLIRRLKDKIIGYQHQIEAQKEGYNKLFGTHIKLVKFMNYNNFWELFRKQRDDLKLDE